ncbi:MAG: precorrin-8X methylmutase [Magnetococcales bacterium]|nr:precorrin-8X methylmutase [Magnetococcales bacterium]MBF0148442.1 precorrin-8X methylmutase [Magnetococcales bacterium]MBF0346308.1 precorrin-8X methylmutase [Magnetococcales bacterium]
MNQLAPPIVAAGQEIESASFRHIDAHAGPHPGYTDEQWPLVRRLIHTSGDFEFNGLTRFHPEAMAAGREALARGAPLVVDVNMIQAGLTPRRLLPLNLRIHQFNADPEVIRLATVEGTTRTVQAMRMAWRRKLLDQGVVAIGNAPTALLEVIRLIREEGVRPSLVIGMPVGFISAAESKDVLMTLEDPPWIAIQGTKGGSTLVVAALHALMDLALGGGG